MARQSKKFTIAVLIVALGSWIGCAQARDSTVQDRFAFHVLNRLAFGPSSDSIADIRRLGSEAWIDQQLHPETIPESPDVTARLGQLETLALSPADLFEQYGPPQQRALAGADPAAAKAARQRARIIVLQAAQARLTRAIESPRQLQEVMVDFWFNHFNVFAGKGLDHLWIGNYENTVIRPYALSRFRDLLEATARHPAMLFYLDNWQNTAPGSPGAKGKEDGLNENYAREIMELHTLGVDGGYSQADVIALARIFTGWGIVRPKQALRTGTADLFTFDATRHDFSDKVFLGRSIRGTGANEVEQALDILAASPVTAHHISFELAQYFVADKPSPALVDRLTRTWMATSGNIRAVLKALFDSPEFRDPANFNAKFKTPFEYVVSSVRVAAVPVSNFKPLLGTMARLGEPIYGCETPDGYKNTRDAWLNPDGMTLRLSFATALGSGRLPVNRPTPDDADEAAQPPHAQQPLIVPIVGPAEPVVPIDSARLASLLGSNLSRKTQDAVATAPPPLKAALLLGSPEFMNR